MIRPCQVNELHKMLTMAEKFFYEAGEPGTFSHLGFIDHWQQVYGQNAGVIFTDDDYKCMFGCYVNINPYSGLLELNESFYYAENGKGGLLLKAVIKWADAIGVKAFYLHHQTANMGTRLSQFYSKCGFKLKFARYLREV